MRVSEDFILREIAGEHMLVPVGTGAVKFNGLVTMNEIGSFIFTQLQTDQTEDSLVDRIREEYEVDEATARTDLREYLDQLRQVGALVEDGD